MPKFDVKKLYSWEFKIPSKKEFRQLTQSLFFHSYLTHTHEHTHPYTYTLTDTHAHAHAHSHIYISISLYLSIYLDACRWTSRQAGRQAVRNVLWIYIVSVWVLIPLATTQQFFLAPPPVTEKLNKFPLAYKKALAIRIC